MNILHAITLAALLHGSPSPAVVCHSGTVSYRFTGTPGATFVYSGARYDIPASGWVELLASQTIYLASNGRTLPLDVWPIDAFGTRTVPVQVSADPGQTAPINSNTNTIN